MIFNVHFTQFNIPCFRGMDHSGSELFNCKCVLIQVQASSLSKEDGIHSSSDSLCTEPDPEFVVVHPSEERQRKAGLFHKITCGLLYGHVKHSADITGRKVAVKGYLQEIHTCIEGTSDPDVLDRVTSLLMQASAALQAVSPGLAEEEAHIKAFEIKEKFAPAQKNEVQLKLWQTAKNPGRCQNPTMK